jgi:hypothetical protein
MRANLGVLIVAAALAVGLSACFRGDPPGTNSSREAWGDNIVKPADLVAELANTSGAAKPIVVCAAPPIFYQAGHVPGAVLHGPAASPGVIGES